MLLLWVHCNAVGRPLLKTWPVQRHGVISSGNLHRSTALSAAPVGSVDEWVLSNGGIIGGIKTGIMVKGSVPASEREVVASRTIDKGELVLAVPRQCILTKAKAEGTTLGRALFDRGETLSNDGSYLTILLCEELLKGRRNELSDINEYIIKSLPTLAEFRHLPLFWNDDELFELKGSTVLAFLDIRKLSIVADYELLCDCSSSFKDSVTEEDFWWL